MFIIAQIFKAEIEEELYNSTVPKTSWYYKNLVLIY